MKLRRKYETKFVLRRRNNFCRDFNRKTMGVIIAKPRIFDQSKFESVDANADEQLAPRLHDGIGSRFAFSQIHRLVNEFS
jgi:hypothetical protein